MEEGQRSVGRADVMEKLVKKQLCWNANNIGVRSDCMQRVDEGQRSAVGRHRNKINDDTESSGASSK